MATLETTQKKIYGNTIKVPKSTVITYGRKRNTSTVSTSRGSSRRAHLGEGGTRVATPNNSHCIILGLEGWGQGREHTSDTTEKGIIGWKGQGSHERVGYLSRGRAEGGKNTQYTNTSTWRKKCAVPRSIYWIDTLWLSWNLSGFKISSTRQKSIRSQS